MTAPLHERLAEAAKAAEQWPWITEPRGGPFIYSDHCDEAGNGIQCPAIGIHPDHHPWPATKAFILAAQPYNVAKLCEQVRDAEKAISDLLNCMALAGWEGDFVAEQARVALKKIRGME